MGVNEFFRLCGARVHDERGTSAVEYSLLTSLLSIVLIVVVELTGSSAARVFDAAGQAMSPSRMDGHLDGGMSPSSTGDPRHFSSTGGSPGRNNFHGGGSTSTQAPNDGSPTRPPPEDSNPNFGGR